MADIDVLLPIRRPNASWLGQALSSIEAQREVFPRIVAVIHPDDAGIVSLVESTRLPLKLVFAPREGGLSEALNLGLSVCTATYVARIDADDVAEPDRLWRQASLLQSDPDCAVVGSNALVIDELSRVVGSRNLPISAAGILRMMRWKSAVIHPSTMFRTKAVCDVQGYSTTAIGVEDYDLWLRILAKHSIRSIGRPLLRYRIHRAQVTQTNVMQSKASATVLESRVALARARGESLEAARIRHEAWELRQRVRNLHRSSVFVRRGGA